MKKLLLYTLVLLVNTMSAGTLSVFVHPDTVPAGSWSAKWIGAPFVTEAKKQNLWSCYRKEFQLADKPTSAVARIAVDSKYWLWVNGVMVVREGALKRGPTPTDTFFDEVDLASHLKEGGNTVAILTWYFGKEGFSHKSSGKSGLLFELDTGKEKIISDSSWTAIVHPSFGDTGAPHPNYRLPESNIRFDASKDIAGWEMPGFVPTPWSPAKELGSPDCAPWNRLVKRPVPFWKDYGLKPYTDVASFPLISDGKTIKAKIPYNAQITPYFKIIAKAGEVINIQMDNYRGGSENNVRAEYVTRDGEQAFECYGWMNGHVVEYTFPAGIQILDLKYRETGFDTEFAGTFDCDDDFLNKLRAKAIRTLYITMRDNYMDCPDRERALWWGDAVNELGESFYAFDRRSDLLTRKCIIDLVAWQKADGVLFSPIPAGNWNKDLPLQMLASIGRTGFWTYSFYSGDLETLNVAYPAMKRYLEIWDMKPDGLVVPRPGAWAWGDWGDNVDMGMLYNAWYHIGLQGLRNAARVAKKEGDLPWIEARMKSIEASFNKTYWTGTEYRSPDYKGKTDDRANALAIVAGFAKPEQYPALIEVFKKQAHSSPYMEKYVLEALCLMDQPELAQERMKKRYAKMVNHPDFTTLWEGWGIGSEGFGGGTINHAWSGGPLTIMSQYFAGIAPTAPGFSSYSVLPQMGTLKKITTKVISAKGDIALKLSNKKDSFSLELNSPSGTQATVGIPVLAGETISEVKVNDEVIWKAGNSRGTIPGVDFIEASSRFLLFSVKSGSWSFNAQKNNPSASPLPAKGQAFIGSDPRLNKTVIVAENGDVTWEYSSDTPVDVSVLTNGNFLISNLHGAQEVTRDKKVVWEYRAPTNTEVFSCQPLPDGAVLICECGTKRLVEVDREGKIRKEIRLETKKDRHNQFRIARKIASGNYLVACHGEHMVRELDGEGNCLRIIKTPGNAYFAERLPNGNTLIACGDGHKLIEVDPQDKIVWELNENDLPGNPLRFVGGFKFLPNGNILLCNWPCHGFEGQQPLVVEVTREKKVLWQWSRPGLRGIVHLDMLNKP